MTTPRRLDTALLADLDAGLLDAAQAAAVRAAAAADPHARAVLHALAATRAQLAALDDDPPVPAGLADRWTAALRAELAVVAPPTPARPAAPDGAGPAAPAAHHVSPSPVPPRSAPPTEPRSPGPGHDREPVRSHPPRPPRSRPTRAPRAGGRRGDRRRAVAVGLVLAALVGAGWLFTSAEAPALVVERPQLVALGRSTVGVRDAGGLDDPARRAACLRAVAAPGVDTAAPLLGARRVTLAGQPGVLLVLGTGHRGAFDIVVVDPGCAGGGGTRLAAVHVGPP